MSAGPGALPPDFDLTDPSTVRNPFPVFHRLRSEDPVHWSPALRAWILTRYRDVRTALNDPRFSVDRMRPFAQASERRGRSTAARLARLLALWVVFHDPPDHTRLRKLLNSSFTSGALRRMRPRVEQMVADALDQFSGEGEVELISQFAYPLPARVIMGMIGVPESDIEQVRDWSDALATFIGQSVEPDRYGRAHDALTAMADYFARLAGARRAAPREDLMSALVQAADQSGALSEDELVFNALYLLFAGHETTTNLIGNGVYHLLGHPEALGRLRGDPGLAAPTVEEVLRYDSPSPAVVRIAAEDLHLEGGTIAAGERIVAFMSAANRDPEVFREPDRLDIERRDNPHLALGLGVHFCLGAKLARMEGQIALSALATRLADLRLAGPEPQWTAQLILRGVSALPLTFTPQAG